MEFFVDLVIGFYVSDQRVPNPQGGGDRDRNQVPGVHPHCQNDDQREVADSY